MDPRASLFKKRVSECDRHIAALGRARYDFGLGAWAMDGEIARPTDLALPAPTPSLAKVLPDYFRNAATIDIGGMSSVQLSTQLRSLANLKAGAKLKLSTIASHYETSSLGSFRG